MQFYTLPVLTDNYCYILVCLETQIAVVIDPGDGEKVAAFLQEQGLSRIQIWATHHHWDHTQGISCLQKAYPGSEVWIGARDRHALPQATHVFHDGMSWSFAGYRFVAMHLPGHTAGAVAIYSPDWQAIFTGDTLFTGGCGRALECDSAVLYQSLQRLKCLAPATLLYDGHNYTLKNLRFAQHIWPENKAISARLQFVEEQHAQGRLSVPESLAVEYATNIFLLAEHSELSQNLGLEPGLSCFRWLREQKDMF
jgi:hydroxyacylglutathione hydrolase